MAARLIIEISPSEPNASAYLPDGRSCRADPEIAEALLDCTGSGDVEPACGFVRDTIKVDWRIVARNAQGEYENRVATAAEKAATARAIYFESATDFEDEGDAEAYLIWSAASDFENESEEGDCGQAYT